MTDPVDEHVGLGSAVASGSRVDALRALRDRLAGELEHEARTGFCDKCKRSSSAVAPLAKQLRDTLAELEQIAPVARPKDAAEDELDAYRRARGKSASG